MSADTDFRCDECTPEGRAEFQWFNRELAPTVLSSIVSAVPDVGDAIDFISAIRGRELISGEKLGPVARVAGVLLPIIGTGMLGKISSFIHDDAVLTKFAEAAGKSHQSSL